MRLQRLTGLEREKIQNEYAELKALISRLNEILGDVSKRMEIVKAELLEMKERHGDERRTQLVHSDEDITVEDMIPDEDMVITISNQPIGIPDPRTGRHWLEGRLDEGG